MKVRAKIEKRSEVPARHHRDPLRHDDQLGDRVDPRRQRQGQDQGPARRRQHRRQRSRSSSTCPRAASRTRSSSSSTSSPTARWRSRPAACVIDGRQAGLPRRARDPQALASTRREALLKQELEIRLGELEQQWHWDSLERIFIEERIYRRIEKSKTWESVLAEIREGLKPFVRRLRRAVTDDDIVRLTEIRIKRISAYNRFQADEQIEEDRGGDQGGEAAPAAPHGRTRSSGSRPSPKNTARAASAARSTTRSSRSARPRSSRPTSASTSTGRRASSASTGASMSSCRSARILDDVVCFMADGSMKVARVGDKVFMGRDIIHCAVLPKDGDTGVLHHGLPGQGQREGLRQEIPDRRRDARQALPAVPSPRARAWSTSRSARLRKPCATTLHISLDGRSRARVREFDFDLAHVP